MHSWRKQILHLPCFFLYVLQFKIVFKPTKQPQAHHITSPYVHVIVLFCALPQIYTWAHALTVYTAIVCVCVTCLLVQWNSFCNSFLCAHTEINCKTSVSPSSLSHLSPLLPYVSVNSNIIIIIIIMPLLSLTSNHLQ